MVTKIQMKTAIYCEGRVDRTVYGFGNWVSERANPGLNRIPSISCVRTSSLNSVVLLIGHPDLIEFILANKQLLLLHRY